MIHVYSKSRNIHCKLFSNISNDTYPPTPIVTYVKDETSKIKIVNFVDY